MKQLWVSMLLTGSVGVGLAAEPTYPTRALFGDTHVHTGWSADAGMDGAIVDPVTAYRFALGEEVASNTGGEARLARPFQWAHVRGTAV